MKHVSRWVKRHKVWTVLLSLSGLFVVFCVVAVIVLSSQITPQSTAAEKLVSAKDACTLSSQTFMNTVNEWRKAKGIAPVAYSTQLQSGAQARVADMVRYEYYGHTNPVTKAQFSTIVDKYIGTNIAESEVLDAPNTGIQSLTDFRNSPDHYDALMNANYHYFGSIAVYQQEGWSEYDNNGKLQDAKPGTTNCIVIGEVANKISSPTGSATSASTQSASIPKPLPNCYQTDMIQPKIDYEDASYLPTGQSQTSYSGQVGYTLVCPGIDGSAATKTVFPSSDKTVLVGTGTTVAQQQAQEQSTEREQQAEAYNKCYNSLLTQGVDSITAQHDCTK